MSLKEGVIMAFSGRLVTSRRTRGRTGWRTPILRLGLWRHLLEGLVISGPMCCPGSPAYQPVDALAISLTMPFLVSRRKRKVSRLISQLGCFGVHITRLRDHYCLLSGMIKCNAKANTFSHHPRANGIVSHCKANGEGST